MKKETKAHVLSDAEIRAAKEAELKDAKQGTANLIYKKAFERYFMTTSQSTGSYIAAIRMGDLHDILCEVFDVEEVDA